MTRFYIASDYELMIDIFKGEINFLKSSWQNMLGRPLVVMPLKNAHLGTVNECTSKSHTYGFFLFRSSLTKLIRCSIYLPLRVTIFLAHKINSELRRAYGF